MTRFKHVDDLKDSIGSVGGAMGTWPFRTLWYLCRWERTGQTDENVVHALQRENLAALAELSDHATDEFGLDTDVLDARRAALADATVDEIRGALSAAYREEYGSGGMTGCPYENEGSDMACHRCPVAGAALERLTDGTDGPRVEPPEGVADGD